MYPEIQKRLREIVIFSFHIPIWKENITSPNNGSNINQQRVKYPTFELHNHNTSNIYRNKYYLLSKHISNCMKIISTKSSSSYYF